jgi:nicotinate-nucleotide adenylyltransferase
VLVFGGSFDPPHAYHEAAPIFAVAGLGLRRGACVYVPAARSPFKNASPRAIDAERVAMLRAMLKGRRNAHVWTDEIDRAAAQRERGRTAPSYTIDSVRRLRRILGERVTLRLVIGADQALAFHKWKSAKALVRLAEPVVLPRAGVQDAADMLASMSTEARRFWGVEGVVEWAFRVVDAPVVRESSTELRAMLAGKARWQAIKRLPPAVATIIKAKGLYRNA